MRVQRVRGPHTMVRASRYGRMITIRGGVAALRRRTALERTAGSHALAAAAHRER